MVVPVLRNYHLALLLIGFSGGPWVGRASSNQSLPGVSDFHRVDEHVYRGGQPDEKRFGNLARLRIRTVVDLRTSDGNAEREGHIVEALGMRFIRVPMRNKKQAPTYEQMEQALAVLNDPAAWPVFIRCDA